MNRRRLDMSPLTPVLVLACALVLPGCASVGQGGAPSALKGHVSIPIAQKPVEAEAAIEAFLHQKGLEFRRTEERGYTQYRVRDFEDDLGANWSPTAAPDDRFIDVFVYPVTDEGPQVRLRVGHSQVGTGRGGFGATLSIQRYRNRGAEEILGSELAAALQSDMTISPDDDEAE